jgi:hypothetical protein
MMWILILGAAALIVSQQSDQESVSPRPNRTPDLDLKARD